MRVRASTSKPLSRLRGTSSTLHGPRVDPAATLIEAVRKASKGGKYVSPSLAERFASAMSGKSGATHEVLSDRELEVLKLLARGESLVNIGERLHLSPKTVTTYRSRILDKMGFGSNAELTRYALENGLLS